MFENIITKENLNFNELENNVYKFVCKLGCNIMKEILESFDELLMNTREKNLRNKGKRKTCVKTLMGDVEYERRVYELGKSQNKKKYTYLLEERLSMYALGKVSNNVVEKVLDTVVQTASYRKAEKELKQVSPINLSHEEIRKITIDAGEKIAESEKRMVKLKKENKLGKGEKVVPILFEEADGLWICLQGKDRKEQINKAKSYCKKNGRDYKQPKRIKAELKLHQCYEGWKKDSERHEIINKSYITGFMSSQDIIKVREAKIFSKYDEDKINYRVINGDGALWINRLGGKNIIRQKDRFHIHQEIIRDIEDKEEQEKVRKMFEEKEYKKIIPYIESLKYKTGGEEKAIKKLEVLQSYLSKDIERYTDKIKLPEAPNGIEYRTMGTMESQIFTVLSKRLKGRKAFSKKGATSLAKVSARYIEKNSNISLTKLNDEIKLDTEEEFAEKYIKELERRYKENYDAYITLDTPREGKKEIHTIKNYNINDFERMFIKPIKEILKFEPSSELSSWPTHFTAFKGYKNRKYAF